MAATTPQKSPVSTTSDVPNANTTKAGGKGRFKETITTISTALPIIGAVGTAGVWLAANFYTGEVEVTPDRPFNSLEVRVSDKKGQETVFHTPSFQLMPGQYHLEVTVDSQHKQHFDVKTSFHKHQKIAVHVPVSNQTSLNNASGAAAVTAVPGALGLFTTPKAPQTAAPQPVPAPSVASSAPGTIGTLVTAGDGNPQAALQESDFNASSTAGKKHWWQVWKKGSSQR
ncbi:MAG TPA: hypothetical protein V6C86_16410 [Oculatellaceae cyanobacterium]